ncbi:hypothetical protein PVK06_046483 [Gossypium arboreum]|uniref:Uncharacterized protein n=1 Tax=Gossypium arboreum TaxID=29729 RepID=A0ABR0MB17_GOSAR|nr:hypothetical protein PVK06_046483 [Gossypium arboreum]
MVVSDGNGPSKAAVKRSRSKRASSWAGYNVPPPSTRSLTRECGRGKLPCLPNPNGKQPDQSGT